MKEHASDKSVLNAWRDASHSSNELPRHEGKRRLLLIYIHSFLGSEESFCNFPREVHNLLKVSLAQTHVTYTKIYPRYKSRGPIPLYIEHIFFFAGYRHNVALAESYTTAGHVPNSRIVGLVAFDTPFLGLHPRVSTTAAGRVFSKKAKNESMRTYQSSIDIRIANDDPTFDTNLTNDVDRTQWSGWDGARHFLAKHSGHLSRSVLQYVFSYYDHVGYDTRDSAVGAKRDESGGSVRLVNYYTTACPHSETTNGNDHVNKIILSHRTSQIHDYHVEDGVSALVLPDMRADVRGTVADNRSSDSLLATKSSSNRIDIRSSSSSCDSDEHENKREGSRLRPPGRLFCCVPETARREQILVPLRMEGMEEITAHQSMFLPLGTYYDRLVADAVAKIESWLL
ncbi:hypothetical protein BO83DRAFT_443831 [Aspergillus eucalypticola CBS 122712]|uniref:Uncharacterized protein n=1 Tax=Aspergillus eucalypticola (strain CBS 122712 / IBT 29274) TaxID=1448314 RepID=A0A317VLT3_ASPEC|nr:uncharacterized protein BO83DRAFT_443831 [Aspergillus eucalypticola CBS 122712]PWY74805.1 hypothetical protein BO83DRAFT_443831 [Aspergillus eucalypticola CBS 122712]